MSSRSVVSRRLRLPSGLGVAAAALAFLAAAPRAEACSCAAQCCGLVWVTPQGDRVPANVPGLSWWPGPEGPLGCQAAEGSAEDVRLLHLTAGGEVPVDLALASDLSGFLARPLEALAVGDRYRFVGGSLCAGTERFGSSSRASTFEVTAPAPLPSSLGTIVAGAPRAGVLVVSTRSGSCATGVSAAAAEVTLRLAPAAQPWATLFLYETLVDGAPWAHQRSLCGTTPHGASVYGRGRDVVYAVCASDDPHIDRVLSPGRHSVRFRATLPGAPAPVESEPFDVDLRCDPAAPDAGLLDFADGGVPDGGPIAPAADAGAAVDADAGATPGVPPRVVEAGCRSAPGAPGGAATGGGAMAALLAMLVRRRSAR